MITKIEVFLDDACSQEKRAADARFDALTAKRIFMLGYALYENRVDDAVDEVIRKNVHAEITMRYEEQLSHVKIENIELVQSIEVLKRQFDEQRRSLENANEMALHSVEMLKTLEVQKRDMHIEHLQTALKDAEHRLTILHHDMQKDGVQQLKDMLKERDVQIQMLKNTNASKGVIGEALILETLRGVFDTCDVVHTGKNAHACDVKLTLHPSGDSILFESKYKGYVDKKDISKFESDIINAPESVQGGMFVSILSRNIPGKGSFHMDIVRDISTGACKPICYVAYENEAEFRLLFAHHSRMFVHVCAQLRSSNADETKQMFAKIVQEIRGFIDMLQRNRKRIEEMRTRFTRFCKEVEDDTTFIMDRMHDIISLQNPSCTMTKTHTSYECAACGKQYKTQGGRERHKCISRE